MLLVLELGLPSSRPINRMLYLIVGSANGVVTEHTYASHSRPPNAAAAYEKGVGPITQTWRDELSRLPGWILLRPRLIPMKHEST